MGYDREQSMTRSEQPVRGHPCPYSSESTQGCPRYQPVSAHSSRPGSDACSYLIRTPITKHHWQRHCTRAVPGDRLSQELEGAALAPNDPS
jgi:hypothetical protein